jgi:hypothetical protein
MRVYHNMLLRGLNSIYLQAANIPAGASSSTAADFVGYAAAWARMLDLHHSHEERVIFPHLEGALSAPGLMAANVAQHRDFEAGLARLQKYLAAVAAAAGQRDEEETTPPAYNGAELRAVIEDLAPTLRTHLADEIVTLAALAERADVDWEGCLRGLRKKMIFEGMRNPRAKVRKLFSRLFTRSIRRS